MNKLVFKLFYSKLALLAVALATVFLVGCAGITGKAVQQISNETAKDPEAYFCPGNDCGRVLENKISLANSSVHCAFYDLELKNVIAALSRKSKDAEVKLVMDSSNHEGQIKGDGLRLDNDKQLMHNKFCVIDGSIVMTGSFNPTGNDNSRNNNNIVVIYSKTLAGNYEEEFEELWGGKFGEGNAVKNPVLYVNGIRIESYFCPEDCRLESFSKINKNSGLYRITDLIKNSKESVKVASFTFSNENIADELISAEARGINVTILTESKQRNVMGSQYKRLKDLGLSIKLDGNKYNMHHKFMIIDGKIVITGSPNFTLAGFNKNDENMLIIYDEKLALEYVKEFDSLYNIEKVD